MKKLLDKVLVLIQEKSGLNMSNKSQKLLSKILKYGNQSEQYYKIFFFLVRTKRFLFKMYILFSF